MFVFIFSRNNCENYCKIITQHLITTEESCLVDKIFNQKHKFKHLYEKTPQYIEIRSLLLRYVLSSFGCCSYFKRNY